MRRREFLKLTTALAGSATLYACAPGVTHVEAQVTSSPWYDYYYYPYSDIYLQIGTGFYFYFFDGAWHRVRQLPPYIALDRRGRRKYRIHGDRPWVNHDVHRHDFELLIGPGWYDYYYYPYSNIYFSIGTGFYFYFDNGVWRRSRRLPRHIHLDRRREQRYRMHGDRPWSENSRHRREFEHRRRSDDGDRRRREEEQRRRREDEQRRRREEDGRRQREEEQRRRREEDGRRQREEEQRRRRESAQPRPEPAPQQGEARRRDGRQGGGDARRRQDEQERRRWLERWRNRRETGDR